MKKFSLSLATVLLGGLLNLSPAFAAPTVFGEITEVIAAAGYTYVEIDTGNGKVWAAGPETTLKVGERTGFDTKMPMANFHSKSMNRDFPVIYFVDKYLTDEAAGKQVETKNLSSDDSATMGGGMSNMPGMGGMAPSMGSSPHSPGAMHNQGGQSGQAMKPVLKEFAKVDGGNTIAEIYAQKKSLAGKTILVRGQVTKYTASVMGKNWLHIVDSSGNEDLTIVTADKSGVGDVVVIEGKLELDKDFSFGYSYSIIVEDAKVTIE